MVDWDEFCERLPGYGRRLKKSDQSEVHDSGSHSLGLIECVVQLFFTVAIRH